MKIGLIGDLHLHNVAPRRRLDHDYLGTLMGKLDQAYQVFTNEKCDIVLQPGDYFDTCTVAKKVVSEAIRQLIRSEYAGHVYTVWGQHDVSGHSETTVPNSPLTILEAAQVVTVLGSEPEYPVGTCGTLLANKGSDGRPVTLYGAPFGMPIPTPKDGKKDFNILVGHVMCGDRPLYPEDTLISPVNFLKTHPEYDLVFLGDYHYRFRAEHNDQRIVNVGALVRKTIGTFDLQHEPACGVFDTNTLETTIHKLHVEKVSHIFNTEQDVKSNDNAILAELVERLGDTSKVLCDWKRILGQVLAEMKATPPVSEVIDKTIEEVQTDGR